MIMRTLQLICECLVKSHVYDVRYISIQDIRASAVSVEMYVLCKSLIPDCKH